MRRRFRKEDEKFELYLIGYIGVAIAYYMIKGEELAIAMWLPVDAFLAFSLAYYRYLERKVSDQK